MTTKAEQATPLAEVHSIYQVNVDPTDPVTGTALLSYIIAAAARRAHLLDAVISVQFDRQRGIGVLVGDAGQREHLANALGFQRGPGYKETYSTQFGTGTARLGMIEGVEVRIWNMEP